MMVFIAKLFSPAVSPLMAVALLLIGGIVLFYRKPRIARAALISALAILLIAGNVWFSSLLAWLLEARTLPYAPLPDAQAIVVLSSDVHAAIAPQPSVTLDGATANRLLYTAQLYRRRLAPLVIVSGGRLQW